MSARRATRVAVCGRPEAAARLASAKAFLAVAELTQAEANDPVLPLHGVAAAIAVLVGIAAADTICCIRLGEMSRGDDHSAAATLLGTAAPEGMRVHNDLTRLLAIKDKVHYQAIVVTNSEMTAAIRQARRLVDAAVEAIAWT